MSAGALIVLLLLLLVVVWCLHLRFERAERRLEYLREYCDDLRQKVEPTPAPPPRPPVWRDIGYPSRWDR